MAQVLAWYELTPICWEKSMSCFPQKFHRAIYILPVYLISLFSWDDVLSNCYLEKAFYLFL